MASTVLRRGAVTTASLLKGTLPACSQARCIVSKEFRDPNYKRPTPFPYETESYTAFKSIFLDTTQRFDENTKIIVVDGPPTGDKEKFARYIAEKLDMKYMPDADMDMWYLDDYGVDLRQLNKDVPPSMRTLDIHQWLQKPNHFHTARLQKNMMFGRFCRYFDTINHVLNTGQGVVCHRSFYSAIAFEQTCLDQGWMSRPAFDFIQDSKTDAAYEFLRPHVLVYLDMEPQTIIDNANKRNEKGEQNSPFYTPEVLSNLIENYKNLVVRPLSDHAEVLVYDWNQEGDYDAIVDDICDLDFSKYTKYHEKMNDWTLIELEKDWKLKRGRFNHFHGMRMKMQLERVPMRDIPELFPPGQDIERYKYFKKQLPSQQYVKGYNKAMGDKVSWLFA